MAQELLEKAKTLAALWHFVIRNWRSIMEGIVLGAVIGLISPTVVHSAGRIGGRALGLINLYSRDVAVWPKRPIATLFVLTFVAMAFYTIRLTVFLTRFLLSYRAGLVSGVGFIWFLASAATFTVLSFTGALPALFIFLAAVTASVILIRRDASINEDARAVAEADPDTPILKSADDILGRDAVVTSLVRAIVSDRAPVVALTGAFGDGKTSVLNLLSTALEQRHDVVFVRFSTWLPMDEETLVSTLLSAVLAKLETKLFVPKIKRDLLALTRLLFSVLPKLPASLMELVAKPSQEQQTAELQRNLSRLPVRVAVLLDDMDRMRRRELDVLFKILRGVPEFPQFTYVCAFDPDSLVQTLRRNDTEQSREEAERFLEKFFPDEIPLPKIDASSLAVEFEKRFYAICDRNNLIMEPEQRQKFKDQLRPLWQKNLKRYFGNLRRVKRFTNRISRSLPLVGQEVNLQDYVLLEMVRMMKPVLFEEIFRNAPYFMFTRWRSTAWLEMVHPDEEEEQKIRKRYFDTLFGELKKPPEGIVLALLSEVFPTVKSYLTEGGIALDGASDPDEAQRERRVYHPDFFPRYFILNVPAELFGEKELSTFIAAMNEKSDVPQCVAMFHKKYTQLQEVPMKKWDFLRRVDLSISRFSLIALEALPAALSELSDQLEGEMAPFDERAAIRIVFHAADRLRSSVGTQNVLEAVIRGAPADQFAMWVLNECGAMRNRILQDWSAIDKSKLEFVFRERMNAKCAPGGRFSFFAKERRTDITPLGRWALCGSVGREQVHEYLRREFQSEPSNLGRFLSYFYPLRDAYPGADPVTAITTYFPIDELQNLLDQYGSSSSSSPEESQAIQEFKSRSKD
jgi:predicted KAP-like P-loop ATPase